MACEGAILHFVDTAKTIITLCIKDLKMFSLETNFESTRPRPHHVETKTISLSSRPRPQKIGLETESLLKTYITVLYNKLITDSLFYKFLSINQSIKLVNFVAANNNFTSTEKKKK